MKIIERLKYKFDDWWNPTYCQVCSHCGYVDCCGVRSFLINHVQGRTNCPYEADVIEDIIKMYENYPKE